MSAYECHNPSFNDLTLSEQIEIGVNDWCVEGKSGHIYYGQTAAQAIAICARYADN